MTSRVNTSIADHVAEVTLNRPDKLNALDIEMFEALASTADELASDANVRAVVLSGAGGNFSAGIDLSVLGDGALDVAAALATPLAPSPANFFQKTAYAWRELPVPVICAIEGVAFGGGLQVALGADIRIAAPDARLSIMESKWGIIPDMGLTTTLRHLVPPDRVKELAFTARILEAEEAMRLGLITDVAADPLAAAKAMAAVCAERSPDAIKGIKTLINQSWQLSDADALALEATLQSRILGTSNQREAVAANLDKRKPKFSN